MVRDGRGVSYPLRCDPVSDQAQAGQKGLTAGSGELNRTEFHVRQLLGKAATVRLVKVVKVKNGGGALAEGGRLTVQQLVNQVDGQGKPQPHGNTFDIPYTRAQGGANAVIIDPEVGDIGLIVVADRDISKVKATKAAANPGSNRRNDVADGIYIGGILNGVPKQYVQFTADGVTIADKNGNVWAMKSDGVHLTTKKLMVSGDIVAGYGGEDQVSVQNHMHENAGGIGNSGKPVPGS